MKRGLFLTAPTNDFDLATDPRPHRRGRLRSSLLPMAVLVVSLAATGGAWYSLKYQAEASAEAAFDNDTRLIAEGVNARMLASEDALQALVGLFAASNDVSRDDWRHFVDQLELRGDHPGIDTFGFVKRLDARQLADHERNLRAQGLPDFHVWPEGNRHEHMVVTYMEPLAGEYGGMLGYDLLENPTSRAAMERARTGATSLTGRWEAPRSTRSNLPAKMLLFTPLYLGGRSPAESLEGTEGVEPGTLLGYVFALLDSDDMMVDVLGHSVSNLGLAVQTGDTVETGSLLFANPRAREALDQRSTPAFSRSVHTSMAGQNWTLRFFSEPYAQAVPERQLPLIALAAGIPLSLLLFGIAWSQATLRSRAARIAEKMTASLRTQAGLLDLTHDTVLLRDHDNIIRYWNRAASDTYGFSAGEAIGRTADDLLRTQFPQPLEEIWRSLRSSGRWEGELVHTRRDGTRIIVASRWAVQRDEGGRIAAILETNNDVTRQRQAEVERNRLEASLQQAGKLEAIGTLAGGIAHDFNNILGAILGYGELAQNEAQPESAARRYIDSIMSAGQRAKSLVARVLAFSRSGLGQREPVHVQSVIVETLDLLAASCPDGVKVEHTLVAADAAVAGDPTQIHQIALNLCTNAVQAMKQGGTLGVQLDVVTLAESRTLIIGAVDAGEYVRLAVSDTGGGIDPALRERIFDPFFTTKGVGVGTGLGLSLVHGIATDLGGGVDMRSEVSRGTTFIVYLPCCGRASPVLNQRGALPRGNGEIVMLVDDEETLVRLGEEMLAALGYEPAGFVSAAEALKAFRSDPERFSALLSDENMPGMTGSQLAEQVRSLHQKIPILLMTGYATVALGARAAAVGAAGVLSKPLDSGDIARSLDEALSRSRRSTTDAVNPG